MQKKLWYHKQYFRNPNILLGGATGVVFVFLAARIASARVFLPYDGSYHFGLIKLYTQHLNPFLASQPQGADALGAVARDPSYLYHYLMSFPLRAISPFIHSQIGQVYFLRGINIGLGLVTLYLTYRLARHCGLPKIGAQLVSLALAVTPVFYDLSAQINYDNLLIPLTLVSVLLTLRVTEEFRQRHISVVPLTLLVVVVIAASLVKYSYLPIALAISIYITVSAIRNLGLQGMVLQYGRNFIKLRTVAQVMLVGVVLLSGVLWAQRYGVNIARYHTPHPQCDTVLSVSECSQYSPWARNYQLHETRNDRAIGSFTSFSEFWIKSVSMEVYATVHAYPGYVAYSPLQALRVLAGAVVLIAIAAALMLYTQLRAYRSTGLFFGLAGGMYVAMLFAQNLLDYWNLHEVVAVQGRYLLPVLALLYVGVALVYQTAFAQVRNLDLVRFKARIRGIIVVAWLGSLRLREAGSLAFSAGLTQLFTALKQPILFARPTSR